MYCLIYGAAVINHNSSEEVPPLTGPPRFDQNFLPGQRSWHSWTLWCHCWVSGSFAHQNLMCSGFQLPKPVEVSLQVRSCVRTDFAGPSQFHPSGKVSSWCTITLTTLVVMWAILEHFANSIFPKPIHVDFESRKYSSPHPPSALLQMAFWSFQFLFQSFDARVKPITVTSSILFLSQFFSALLPRMRHDA